VIGICPFVSLIVVGGRTRGRVASAVAGVVSMNERTPRARAFVMKITLGNEGGQFPLFIVPRVRKEG
jgi:hypothetical protein